MFEFDGFIMVYWYVLDFGDVFSGICRIKWGRGSECLLGWGEVLFLIVFSFFI